MPIVLGLDVGTTTITTLALDTDRGRVVARDTTPNDAETTSPSDKSRGFCEWDARRIAALACRSLQNVARSLAGGANELAGIGLTGQQHGVVLLNSGLNPLGPFVNWQDRRTEERQGPDGRTYLEQARTLAGEDARQRAGCELSPGYMGTTLYWMKTRGDLPGGAVASFLVDYVGAMLSGERIVTDATSAASSGVFNVRTGDWDNDLIDGLGLPETLFPELGEGSRPLGKLTTPMADATGLPAGLPVCVGIGDNQASFYGSVAELSDTILVNVGTGGQVAAFCDRFLYSPKLETRPFPNGYLLASAGLCGGRTYAVLEQFFRQVGHLLIDSPAETPIYEAMNQLAASVPRGSDGLRCQPLFTGTRQDPDLRASWSGISARNFTPAHMTRSLLEGMARVFRGGFGEIRATSGRSYTRLVGSGNAVRENRLLADIVADELAMPLREPAHREEAAFGAALSACVGLAIFTDHDSASQIIRYDARET